LKGNDRLKNIKHALEKCCRPMMHAIFERKIFQA
jgi:hypothetical protein